MGRISKFGRGSGRSTKLIKQAIMRAETGRTAIFLSLTHSEAVCHANMAKAIVERCKLDVKITSTRNGLLMRFTQVSQNEIGGDTWIRFLGVEADVEANGYGVGRDCGLILDHRVMADARGTAARSLDRWLHWEAHRKGK